ncbi:hypothetical protein [Streptomyces sp. NPDC050485]|uniref:hypothetical protein n=1 Tax=Streptomyces sp. NPDC050485 TaxID=3365617 RepID=UPI0037A387E8
MSTYKVSSALRDVHVLSTKPLVGGGHPGEGSGVKISDIYSVDDTTGKELAHITIPDEYAIECHSNQVGTRRHLEADRAHGEPERRHPDPPPPRCGSGRSWS